MEKLVFLFPGQGSQFVGMGRGLYKEFNTAKRTFEEAEDTLCVNIRKICFEGSFTDLNKTANIFSSILTVGVACYRVFMDIVGIEPFSVIGHSLGEYSALVCSGALNFNDALKIVIKRADLADKITGLGIGMMTIINGIDAKIVENECKIIKGKDRSVNIACYNAPNQVAVSGNLEAVLALEDKLIEMGAQITPVLTSAPFHSPIMQPAAEQLRMELGKYSFNQFKWPVISNVNALPYTSPDCIVDNLVSQMTMPVQWEASINYIIQHGTSCFIEMGSQSILKNMLNDNMKNSISYSFGQNDDRNALLEKLRSNIPPKKYSGKKNRQVQNADKSMKTVITMCLVEAVSTRNQNNNIEEYKKEVIKSYEKIEGIQNSVEAHGNDPSREQIDEAIRLLHKIFEKKKVPITEQIERLNYIIEKSATQHILNTDMFIKS